MLRALPRTDRVDRARLRHLARRQWRSRFVPVAIVDLEGLGRTLVVMRLLETRWSDTRRCRLWRLPGAAMSRGQR